MFSCTADILSPPCDLGELCWVWVTVSWRPAQWRYWLLVSPDGMVQLPSRTSSPDGAEVTAVTRNPWHQGQVTFPL